MRRFRLLLGVLPLVACGQDLEVKCPDSPLTYETFGAPFLFGWCRGCHSRDLAGAEARQLAPEGVDFDTEQDAWRHARRIGLRAGPGGTMPPAGGPSLEERRLLVEWVGCDTP